MDKREAQALLTERLRMYRARPYADLVASIGQGEHVEVTGPSGQSYQVDIDMLWDGKPGGNVRVMASIDDGGFRSAFSPLSDSFIKAPDGTFVGED